MGRGDGDGAGGSGGGDGNLASSAVAAALRYRAQAPVIDGLMRELGFDGGSLDSLVAQATGQGAVSPPPSGAATAAASPKGEKPGRS